MYMDLQPIVSASCEDCGITIIMDKDLVTIVQLGQEFCGVTLCFHCERPIISAMDEEFVQQLQNKGVRLISWYDQDQ